jgi:hypothetical protein
MSSPYGDDFTFGATEALFIADTLGACDFVSPHGAVLAGSAIPPRLLGHRHAGLGGPCWIERVYMSVQLVGTR